MHITGNDGATGATIGNSDTQLVIDNAGTNGGHIEFLSSNNGGGHLMFTDTDGVNRGRISYHHNGDYYRFDTAGSERMRISSTGALKLFDGAANYIESAEFRLYNNSNISNGYTANTRTVAIYNTNTTLISHSETGGTNGGSRYTFNKDCYVLINVSQDVLGNSDTSYWSQRLVRDGTIRGYHLVRKSTQWDNMAWSQGTSVSANSWLEIQWNGTGGLTAADGSAWSHYNFLVWERK